MDKKVVYVVLGIDTDNETCLGAFDTKEEADKFNLEWYKKEEYEWVLTYEVEIDLRK